MLGAAGDLWLKACEAREGSDWRTRKNPLDQYTIFEDVQKGGPTTIESILSAIESGIDRSCTCKANDVEFFSVINSLCI